MDKTWFTRTFTKKNFLLSEAKYEYTENKLYNVSMVVKQASKWIASNIDVENTFIIIKGNEFSYINYNMPKKFI